MQFAQQQLRTKTDEFEREQDSNRVLSETLKRVKVESSVLDSLTVQNKEILERLNEQHTAGIEKGRRVEEETRAKYVLSSALLEMSLTFEDLMR